MMRFFLLTAFLFLGFACPQPPLAICGNGIVEESERCDDANNVNGDGCRADCLGVEVCGDGFLDVLEECDDENLIDADGCEADCTLPACENGIKDPGELCFIEKVVKIDLAPQEIIAEDFDQDGRIDLAAATSAGLSINLLFNQGQENFVVQTLTLEAPGDSLVSGDFDGDGDPDLAVTLFQVAKIIVFFNDGTGAFPITETIDTEANPTQLITADFDGNDSLDIAVSQTGSLGLFLNDGTGQFSLGDSVFFEGSPSGLVSADLNEDEQIDLVVSDGIENNISVLVNQGGSFLREEPLPAGEKPLFLTSADFDGNQTLDIVSAHGGSSRELRILFGEGSTSFLPSELIFTFDRGLRFLASGDINQDGSIDLVIPEQFGGNGIHIFLNDGLGGFSQALVFPTNGENRGTEIADWNDDGLPDIAASEESRGEIFFFFSAP